MIRKSAGFSLIELLIGLVFLAVGLLAMAGLQGTSARGSTFSNNLMQATYLAQDRLESLMNLPLGSAELQGGNYSPGSVTTSAPGGSYSSIVFNPSYTVVVNGNLRTIRYTVTWNDGVNHGVTFSTIRSQ
jgi:type IV pilus assembly protein PilV